MQASKINVSVAKNDIKIANRLQNPSINTFFNFGEAGRGNPNQIGASEIIELFKRGPRKKLAKAKYKLASDNYDYEKFNLKMDVAEAYIRLVVAKYVLKKYEQQQQYLESLHGIADRNNHKNKLVETELDVIQSRIALNEITTKVNKAKSETKIARIEFNRTINSKDGDYDSQDVGTKKLSELISLDMPSLTEEIPAFTQIEDAALKNRYDIKIAKKQIDAAEKNLTVVIRQLVPDLEIEGGYAYQAANYSESGTYKSGAYLSAALVNLPLFYTYKPEIKNAKLEIEQANINYASTVNKAKKNLEIAYEKFTTARLILKNYDENILKDTDILFKNFEKMYQSTNVDFSALVSIEETYYDLVNGYSSALIDYYVGWIDFLRELNTENFAVQL